MKKIISVFIINLLLCSVFAFSSGHVTAAGTGKLTLQSVTGNAGETVAVKILLSDNPGLVALHIDIGYDASKLRLLSASDGGLIGTGMAMFGNDLNINPYTLTWVDALHPTNHTGNGIAATLTFKILETAPCGMTPVTIAIVQNSTFDCNLKNVQFSTVNGYVGVRAGSEALFETVKRVLLKKENADDKAVIAFEYDHDKKISILDLLELKKARLA